MNRLCPSQESSAHPAVGCQRRVPLRVVAEAQEALPDHPETDGLFVSRTQVAH